MRKAGGIIGLLAGIFGGILAIVQIIGGAAAGAFGGMEGADAVVALGWLGIPCSLGVFIVGIICIGAKGRAPGIILLVFSILGGIFGFPLVTIAMGFSFLGGLLATIPKPIVKESE